jgi:hypothetical protein
MRAPGNRESRITSDNKTLRSHSVVTNAPTAGQKAGETDIFKLGGTDICTLGLQKMSTQNTNVSVFPNLKMSVRWGSGGGRARSPRRSAAPDRRPLYGRSKPHRLFDRASVSALGS